MEDLVPLLALGVVLLIGVFVYFLVRTEKAEKRKKTELARALGFQPVDPDRVLVEQITNLYQEKIGNQTIELRNVFAKRMPDGEMYLFDLVNTAGEEDSYTEDQAVAVTSRNLNLPVFTIVPQLDIDGFGGKFANALLWWVISKAGNPLEFSKYPEFQKHYLVSSKDEQGTRKFLEDRRLYKFSQLRMIGIHASGNIFVFSKLDLVNQPRTRSALSERVSQAIDVYQIFTE